MLEQQARSAHVDTFARDHLPPRELWPTLEFTLPELQYPEVMNCAVELLDRNVARGLGDRVAFRYPGRQCTYSELLALTNRVAAFLAPP